MESKAITDALIHSLYNTDSSIHGAELLINNVSYNYEEVVLSDTDEVVKRVPVDVDIDYNVQLGKNLLSGRITLWYEEYKELIGGHEKLFDRILDDLLNRK